jgi:hypothetical protein
MSDATKAGLDRLAQDALKGLAAIRAEGREPGPRDRLALPVQDMPCQDGRARSSNMLEVAEGYGAWTYPASS